MINMQPYDVYRAYLALRLHFTTNQYDVIQQQGRVKASKQAFFKRKDLHAIKKIAEEYNDKDVIDFLVANFVSGDRWGGVFDSEASTNYITWKKRIESISYIFKSEIDSIMLYTEKNNLSFDEAFVSNGKHPIILRLYLKKQISIETLVILNKLNKFTDSLDLVLSDDIIWPDVSRIIKKYGPFLQIDKSKYDEILRRRIGHD